MNVTEAAQGRWRSILPALGIPNEFLSGRHQPCLLCGGKDRARFDDKDGKGTYICGQCGSGTGIDLLMKVYGWDFKQAAKEVEKILPESIEFKSPPRKDPIKRLKRISQGLKPIGQEVGTYLAMRGLTWEGVKRLKQHDQLGYYEGGKPLREYPAMVGIVTDRDDKPVTLHITYLDGDGKADVPSPKKIMPCEPTINGCSIRLGTGSHIAVAEGIETALAVMQMFEIPAWATISESGMRRLQVPDFVSRVTICADNDRNFVGQSAAYDLAKRLHSDGRIVDVQIPEHAGTDFADR